MAARKHCSKKVYERCKQRFPGVKMSDRGRISQVVGPVVAWGGACGSYSVTDYKSAISDGVEFDGRGRNPPWTSTVRTIAWIRDGLVRGMAVRNTGAQFWPVGKATLGRILNVVGEPVDELGPFG